MQTTINYAQKKDLALQMIKRLLKYKNQSIIFAFIQFSQKLLIFPKSTLEKTFLHIAEILRTYRQIKG